MSKVFIEETTLTGIGDAIREKEGSTELIPPLEMPARIKALNGGGLALETEALSITLYSLNALQSVTASINLPRATTLHGLFNAMNKSAEANTIVEDLTINCPNEVESIRDLLNSYGDTTLKRLTLNVDTVSAYGTTSAFQGCRALVSIGGIPLDFSAVKSSTELITTFNGCVALEYVRFKGQINVSAVMGDCDKLSKESIESVVSCLSDAAEGQTLTLSTAAVNTAFETSSGSADGSTSAEWTALVDSKPNWTFSLR